MFKFNDLTVYQKAKSFAIEIQKLRQRLKLDYSASDQLSRATMSIMLNIAEGSARFTRADQRRFYIISRGSVFECFSILDYMQEVSILEQSLRDKLTSDLEEISRILYSMIKKLES